MGDDFNKTISDVTEKVVNAVHERRRKVLNHLEAEQKKAQIRSEIGHNQRELTKAYEKLGRDCYAAISEGRTAEPDAAAIELLRSKEKVVELLNEKLVALKENQ